MGQRGGPNIPLDNLQLAFDPRNPKVSLSNYASIFGDAIASAIGASLAGSGTTIGLFLSALIDKLNFTNLSNLNITGSISIYDKFQYTGFQAGTSFYIDNSAGINAIALSTGVLLGTNVSRLNNQVTLNTWQNFAISHNGSNSTITFYKNGASIGSSGSLAPVAATGVSACIGNNFAGQYNFDGTIGTVRVYNKALSAAEILQAYNAQKGRYGL